MFNIGEFSKITGLTVKTLRFYHEQGLLEPSAVDDQSGYRYYAESKIETARVIKQLRELEFSVEDIKEILKDYDSETSIWLTPAKSQNASSAIRFARYRQPQVQTSAGGGVSGGKRVAM